MEGEEGKGERNGKGKGRWWKTYQERGGLVVDDVDGTELFEGPKVVTLCESKQRF